MIFLTGSIFLATQQDMQREAEVYAVNGWELKDPTTHQVSVTLAVDDIEAFCDYLRNKAPDLRPKVWRDRNGVEQSTTTITLRLKGTEMTGSWIRLRARLDPAAQPRQSAPPSTASRPPAHAPVRRAPAPTRNTSHVPAEPATSQPSQLNAWQAGSDADDDDIPF